MSDRPPIGIAKILPREAAEALVNVVRDTTPRKELPKRLEEVTQSIKDRYPSYFRKDENAY